MALMIIIILWNYSPAISIERTTMVTCLEVKQRLEYSQLFSSTKVTCVEIKS